MNNTSKELVTESQNLKTNNIDLLSAYEIVKIMNEEDKLVPIAVEKELDKIAKAVEHIVDAFNNGGRLIYIGAGTSGRLGILDAAECPPTFGTDKNMVIGLIAGGETALVNAVEGAEDDFEQGKRDVLNISISSKDVLVGLTASGRTPYVLGALEQAREIGAKTVGLSCNKTQVLESAVDIMIAPVVGPEVITGSTRLKSGTAEKMVLNMLTTASMINIGKVYNNLMVDVQATNIKLVERSKRIIMTSTGVSDDVADVVLKQADNNVKLAILMILTKLPKEEAIKILGEQKGFIRKALKSIEEKENKNEKVI